MKRLTLLPFVFACFAVPAHAAYSGLDFSGTYECSGEDGLEGPYNGRVTLRLVPAQSKGKHAAYNFTLDLPGGAYPGHAVARDREMAIAFSNADPARKDFGASLARFIRRKNGKWQFTTYYYQPQYKGGNSGTETCVQQ